MYNLQRNEHLKKWNHDFYILDYKMGDVNHIPNHIYLIGKKSDILTSAFTDVTLIIQDGKTGMYYSISLEDNRGYDPKLFLGDFTGNKVNDIFISIASGGSGGTYYYYIYSFNHNIPKKIFDHDEFFKRYHNDVTYKDDYKVEIVNNILKKIYLIDLIGIRDKEYLSKIYYENGKLIKPITGWVDPLSGLYPIDTNGDGIYELLGMQSIAGTYHADSVGTVETWLRWDGKMFTPYWQTVAIDGKQLNG